MAYVQIDLGEIDTDELIEELSRRHYGVFENGYGEGYPDEIITSLEKIYDLKRDNRSFDRELSTLVYNILGKIL